MTIIIAHIRGLLTPLMTTHEPPSKESATSAVVQTTLKPCTPQTLNRVLLVGSWVAISGVKSPLIWVTSIVTLLITLLISTHEPPSSVIKVMQGLYHQPKPYRSLKGTP